MHYWIKWQEKIDHKKNPTMLHIAKTSSLQAALAIYIALRNDNAMKWVTVGQDVHGPIGQVNELIVKEYVA